jgi:uncharacterized membrane protein YgaE (UPF0421/DUF939 family)
MEEMVKLVEKFATLVKTTERRQKEFEQQVEQQYALQTSRKDQIEDILKDHIELIKKLHSQQLTNHNGISDLTKTVNDEISSVKDAMVDRESLKELETKINENVQGKLDDFRFDQNR